MVATAQLEGALTREQKQLLLQLFSETFKLNEEEAIALFGASCHLLKDVMDVHAEVDAILAPTLTTFSDAQKQSLQAMMSTIANAEGPATEAQTTLMARVANAVSPQKTKRWE